MATTYSLRRGEDLFIASHDGNDLSIASHDGDDLFIACLFHIGLARCNYDNKVAKTKAYVDI